MRKPASRPAAPKTVLPAIDGRPGRFPRDEALCPWCRKNKVFEPHSFAILSGSALKRVGKDRFEIADDVSGFLEVGWHGAHSEEGSEGPDADIGLSIAIAVNAPQGQFELYFCSTDCMRAFLNFCVDELEREVDSEGRERLRSQPNPRINRKT